MKLNELQDFFKTSFAEIAQVLELEKLGFYVFGINETLHAERAELEYNESFVIMLYSGAVISEISGVLWANWDLNFLLLTEVQQESPEAQNEAILKAENIGFELIKILQNADKDNCNYIQFALPVDFAPTERAFFGNAFGQMLTLNVQTCIKKA